MSPRRQKGLLARVPRPVETLETGVGVVMSGQRGAVSFHRRVLMRAFSWHWKVRRRLFNRS